MKGRYFFLAIIVVFLAGCHNRFEEYEPYSAFDDRMAVADRGQPMMPDDQMPPESYEQYGYSNSYNEYTDPRDNYPYQPRTPAPRSSPSASSGSVSSSGNAEVPFSDTRSPKHPVNLGAL